MSNLSNRALHSIFGCPNSSETKRVATVGASGHLLLDENEIYRITCTADCFISVDSSEFTLGEASGVRLFPSIPEMIATTGKLTHLNTLQDVTGGADTGLVTITKMLTRGA